MNTFVAHTFCRSFCRRYSVASFFKKLSVRLFSTGWPHTSVKCVYIYIFFTPLSIYIYTIKWNLLGTHLYILHTHILGVYIYIYIPICVSSLSVSLSVCDKSATRCVLCVVSPKISSSDDQNILSSHSVRTSFVRFAYRPSRKKNEYKFVVNIFFPRPLQR